MSLILWVIKVKTTTRFHQTLSVVGEAVPWWPICTSGGWALGTLRRHCLFLVPLRWVIRPMACRDAGTRAAWGRNRHSRSVPQLRGWRACWLWNGKTHFGPFNGIRKSSGNELRQMQRRGWVSETQWLSDKGKWSMRDPWWRYSKSKMCEKLNNTLLWVQRGQNYSKIRVEW